MTVFFNVCCFFSHCNAHAASHHLVNDDRPVPWHQSGGDPPLATRLSTPLASSTRDRASDRAGPGCRTESARAYGGFRWLSTVPSRTVSPGHQRLDRPYNNRGGTGACLLASGVCLCSLLQVCACVFRTRPLLHRFSAGLPGTCHGRRAADSRIEFGTNRSRLASGDRLGCADPLVGSLYGFLRIAYLIFYYGTTLILMVWLQFILPLKMADGTARGLGGSRARAMIWHHCSALKVTGAPDRIASCKRSGTVQPRRVSQCR